MNTKQTTLTNPDSDEKYESIAFYHKLVKKHGRKNAKDKLKLITTLPKENFEAQNISVYSVPYGDERCFCSHPIGNVFVVKGIEQSILIGGNCLGYIMDYLKISKRHIKDALTLLSRNAKFREYGVGSREIVLTELAQEYRTAKKAFYAQKKGNLQEGKEKMDKFIKGIGTLEDLFPNLSKNERKFIYLFVNDKEFRTFTTIDQFWGRISFGKRTTVSFLEQLISGKEMSDKQSWRINNLVERF